MPNPRISEQHIPGLRDGVDRRAVFSLPRCDHCWGRPGGGAPTAFEEWITEALAVAQAGIVVSAEPALGRTGVGRHAAQHNVHVHAAHRPVEA